MSLNLFFEDSKKYLFLSELYFSEQKVKNQFYPKGIKIFFLEQKLQKNEIHYTKYLVFPHF
jgi:hypothetical protein